MEDSSLEMFPLTADYTCRLAAWLGHNRGKRFLLQTDTALTDYTKHYTHCY